MIKENCDQENIQDEEFAYLDWFIEIQCLNHIPEQILSFLDDKSLANCRRVSKSWKNFVDNNNALMKKQVLQMKSTKISRLVDLRSSTLTRVFKRASSNLVMQVNWNNKIRDNPWKQSLTVSGTICEMFPIWALAFEYVESNRDISDLQTLVKTMQNLLVTKNVLDWEQHEENALKYLIETKIPIMCEM